MPTDTPDVTFKEMNRIVTPCPACGSQTLFIGNGGHLTCSVIGCPEPGVAQFVNNLKHRLKIVNALEYAAVARLKHDATAKELDVARAECAKLGVKPDVD